MNRGYTDIIKEKENKIKFELGRNIYLFLLVIFIGHLTVCMLSRQENKTIYIELSHFKTAPKTDICLHTCSHNKIKTGYQ